MPSNQWRAILCLVALASAAQAQYIPFPTATKLNQPAPYINPSLNDPLFYDSFRAGPAIAGGLDEQRANAIKFLGSNVFYDAVRKIFINVVSGDYYDPTTGLVYRRVAADRAGFVNGRVGPMAVSSKHAPKHRSDAVDLPKDLKRKVFDKLGDSSEEDDCRDCERKGQCFRCKKHVVKADCNLCWSNKAFANCDHCTRDVIAANAPLKAMGQLIVTVLNKYRRDFDLKDVRFNQHLYETAMVQNLYMANRGYLNEDNFLANISTFKSGLMSTAYVQERKLGDSEGAEKFVGMWRKTPDHNENLTSTNIDQCGAAVYFDEKSGKHFATLVCVKL